MNAMTPSDTFALTPTSERTIRVTRHFAVPPAKVWRALTEPELVRRWMTTPSSPMTACEMDVRPGGAWRFAWGAMVAHGTYREVEASNRIVHTELFEPDWTDGETVCTTMLAADKDGTLLTMDILYSGVRGRDMALTSDMGRGMQLGYDKLDALADAL